MKTLLLAGGLGTRLREETEFRPKPMVEVGGRPILWHIMKGLSVYGVSDFVVATGYKSNVIKEFFLNYRALTSDFTISLGHQEVVEFHGSHSEEHWQVSVIFTGDLTETGGRVLRASGFLGEERFLLTYGDGVADVNIDALLETHIKSKALCTVTAVEPQSRFGVLDIGDHGVVKSFQEKPNLDGWINIGFMVLEPEALDYFTDDCSLERGPLAGIAREGKLSAYKHSGFWQPMDTFREAKILNDLWDSGKAPWKLW